MKKQNNKVYSASDFSAASVSILVEETRWKIDSVSCTAVGEYSKVPLFEVGFKRDVSEGDPNDATAELEPNRTFYVREGRPLFSQLVRIWEATEDASDVEGFALQKYKDMYFRGRVERLSGVLYNYYTKRGTIVQRNKVDIWYPSTIEEGVVLDDFIFLCNKGVYTPLLEQMPTVDPLTEALKSLDPGVIAAIKAMK